MIVESIAGSDEWILRDDLSYSSADGRQFRVPARSLTDLFSIPGLLRSFMFRARKYAEAAVIHDGGYRGTLEEQVAGAWVNARLSRKETDELLRECSECLGAPKSLQYALYWGVRAGGRWSFKG